MSEKEVKMSIGDKTVKCPICGEPYVFISYCVGDQSACPKCRAKARGNQTGKIKTWEKE